MKSVIVPDDLEKKVPSVGAAVLCWLLFTPAGIFLTALRIIRKSNNKRILRFRRIAAVIDDRKVIALAELSVKTAQTLDVLCKDLDKMIADGYFVAGTYIDRAHSNLVIGNAGDCPEAWARPTDIGDEIADALSEIGEAVALGVREFFKGVERANERKNEEKTYSDKRIYEAEKAPKPQQASGNVRLEKAQLIRFAPEYEAMLRKIRAADEAIDDETVSERIVRIESLCGNMFQIASRDPSREEEVRKFMNYYLPTTLKLLDTYALMEKQSYQGENIVSSRKKIEDILNTLVDAFEMQNDKLFHASAIDIDSDVEVLTTLLKKDGLVQDDLTDGFRGLRTSR